MGKHRVRPQRASRSLPKPAMNGLLAAGTREVRHPAGQEPCFRVSMSPCFHLSAGHVQGRGFIAGPGASLARWAGHQIVDCDGRGRSPSSILVLSGRPPGPDWERGSVEGVFPALREQRATPPVARQAQCQKRGWKAWPPCSPRNMPSLVPT